VITKNNTGCSLCGKPIETTDIDNNWCNVCEETTVRFLVCSLTQAGNTGEIEKTLNELIKHRHSPYLKYYLGLVKAQAGNLDDSINLMESLADRLKTNQEYRRLFTSILTKRASRQIKSKNFYNAIQDLILAAEISPGDSLIEQSLSLANSIDILSQVTSNSNSEALEKVVQTYRKIQKRQPDNNTIIHNLAVLSYRLASEAEEQKKQKVADTAWRETIANWSLLVSSESFWTQWAGREKLFYDIPVKAEDTKALRTEIRERLLQDFRLFRSQYGEVNDTKAVQRHREYEVLFLLETKTAAALRRLVNIFHQKNITPPVSICCGPLMLETLGLTPAVREIIKEARTQQFSEERIKELEDCLSPTGRIEILIETNWLEQAETELDTLIVKNPSDSDLCHKMVRVQIALAKQSAATQQFDTAVKKLEKGLRYAGEKREIEDVTATIFLDEAKRIMDSGEQEKVIDQAISLLEKGRKLATHNTTLAQELARHYAQRAISVNNQNKYEAARKDIHNAFILDNNNGLALQNGVTIYRNLAINLANAGQWSEAIDVVNEGLRYLDSDLLRQLLIELRTGEERARRGW
jgi:tetratricopeptide (TPR) repeat protein